MATRLLTPTDSALLDAFLEPHTAEAYFLRSNALGGGLDYQGKFLQAEYFGAFEGEKLVGAIAYSWMNTLLIYAPDPAAQEALARAITPAILKRGGVVEAILGLAVQVDGVIAALGIPPEALREHDQNPDNLFTLEIAAMRTPPLPDGLRVRLAGKGDADQLIAWRVAFNIESTAATPGPALEAKVRTEILKRIEEKELFILENGDDKVAFAAVAGSVPDTVMVGPVWTPPELRARGYGRLVTAHGILALAAVRPALRRAVLFASRVDAVRAYEALGFVCLAPWGFKVVGDGFRVRASV